MKKQETGVVNAEPVALARPMDGGQVGALFEMAIDKGISVEGLEKLVLLHERIADRAATREFAEALAGFQAECPAIQKTKRVQFATRGGMSTNYTYAALDDIVAVVRPLLAARGLSYTWDSETNPNSLSCTCTLRHENGHSVTATFACPTESKAGMGEQQKFAAALTFARRQSLVQVLGLTTTEPDTDGVAVGAISPDQQANIEALISEVGADEAKFLKFLGVAKVADIPQGRYQGAVQALERKRSA